MTINGSAYLPLRATATLLGYEVDYHEATNTIDLRQVAVTSDKLLTYPQGHEYCGSREFLERSITTIQQLEDEHETAGGVLKELRHITNQYTVPADGCGTYVKMYDRMQELESDIFQHIHLENNILHPRLMQELGKNHH